MTGLYSQLLLREPEAVLASVAVHLVTDENGSDGGA